jgi:hypothetical protein
MRVYVRTKGGDDGSVDVDPDQSISEQICPVILIILLALIALLGAVLVILTYGNY